MKGLPRPWPCPVSLAFLCLLGLRVMSFDSVEAAQLGNITTAKQLLALKEGELRSFVAAVEDNARNCDVLNGCSGSNCSRTTCYKFGTPGDPNYSCLDVSDNFLCTLPGNARCTQRNFDFSKGGLRRVDPVDIHIARTVCTHRTLDDHFKSSTMNDPKHFFRVFFGAVDGTFRIYPGEDEDCEVMYDPRIRPWYRESTYIPKVVTVVIDTGLNMRENISGSSGESYINKAITTALKILDTLRENVDYVTIACFDGERIEQLNVAMTYNNASMYQSFKDSLTAVVTNGSTSDPNSTHTNRAINDAISRLTSSNSIPATYLKVVIALIGGQQYPDIADLNLSATPNMNLFVYSFRAPPEQGPQCNQALRASLEGIPIERLSNPLYALQSYYSFLAKLHISFMKNLTDYGTRYPDFSGIDNQTLTLSKAAFGPTGELLGVLGLDIFQQKVEQEFNNTIQFDSIVDEASTHKPQEIFDTTRDLTANVCFNHTEACPNLEEPVAPPGFLCGSVASPDSTISCCGSCKVSIPPRNGPPGSMPQKEEEEIWRKYWYAVLLIPIVVLSSAVIGLVVYCCCNKNRRRGRGGRHVATTPPSNGGERIKGLQDSD